MGRTKFTLGEHGEDHSPSSKTADVTPSAVADRLPSPLTFGTVARLWLHFGVSISI